MPHQESIPAGSGLGLPYPKLGTGERSEPPSSSATEIIDERIGSYHVDTVPGWMNILWDGFFPTVSWLAIIIGLGSALPAHSTRGPRRSCGKVECQDPVATAQRLGFRQFPRCIRSLRPDGRRWTSATTRCRRQDPRVSRALLDLLRRHRTAAGGPQGRDGFNLRALHGRVFACTLAGYQAVSRFLRAVSSR